ncbi:unnamed protein product, partial [Prorocentrum cordatum]
MPVEQLPATAAAVRDEHAEQRADALRPHCSFMLATDNKFGNAVCLGCLCPMREYFVGPALDCDRQRVRGALDAEAPGGRIARGGTRGRWSVAQTEIKKFKHTCSSRFHLTLAGRWGTDQRRADCVTRSACSNGEAQSARQRDRQRSASLMGAPLVCPIE